MKQICVTSPQLRRNLLRPALKTRPRVPDNTGGSRLFLGVLLGVLLKTSGNHLDNYQIVTAELRWKLGPPLLSVAPDLTGLFQPEITDFCRFAGRKLCFRSILLRPAGSTTPRLPVNDATDASSFFTGGTTLPAPAHRNPLIWRWLAIMVRNLLFPTGNTQGKLRE